MIDLLNKEETANVTFPQNKIVLLNGKELVCYPKEQPIENKDNDQLTLDKTGEYLSFKKPARFPTKEEEEKRRQQREKENAEQNFFIDHAYFFFNHADAILNDSRMFLAPVTAHNGLAYTGGSGFQNPTLGVYLEWWIYGEGYARRDDKGKDALTCILSGSPLSGANSCGGVYPDGEKKTIHHNSFGYLVRTFISVNSRYADAKGKYEAYSIEEVYEKLKVMADDNASVLRTKLLVSEGTIASLEAKLARQNERYDELSKKYEDVCIENSKNELERFSEEYNKKAEQTKKDLEELEQERSTLSARMKKGELTNVEYQKLLRPVKELINDVKWELNSFRYKGMRKLTEEKHLSMAMVNEYLRDHATDTASESL